MNVKEFKTSKGEFVGRKVPNDATKFKISSLGYLCYKTTVSGKWNVLSQPNEIYNSYKIIGAANEITEEKAKEVIIEPVKRYIGVMTVFGYKSYLNVLDLFETALESFHSLIQANQMYKENPRGEIQLYNDTVFNQWIEAEENTGNWLILKKV